MNIRPSHDEASGCKRPLTLQLPQRSLCRHQSPCSRALRPEIALRSSSASECRGGCAVSSVVVASQREIEAGTADRVDQLLAMVPKVLLGNGSKGPAIRVQDTTGALQALPAFMGGNRPCTTLIIDRRRDTYNEFVFGAAPVWDVNRVEVFRSPQTTTQGQNSIAGAIFVYSNDPTVEPSARPSWARA